MRSYELTYIIRPDLDEAARTALIERVASFITAEGGVVRRVTPWGLRPLTYPIRKQREGYYVFCIVELNASSVARVEQRLKLTEEVIRYLLVRAEEDGKSTDRDAALNEGVASVTDA
ncbi:MAG: 30S ribosomal protein S6 [Anaerolineae bacterium]|nr:30S ribosomal protein S6 [Thermoflexales bacterium]MDW8394629.1 30S ribosomal protein S6 [Anaerolineae bacterium]